jgi:glycosyltransferase involved in cell wall biosynthesis
VSTTEIAVVLWSIADPVAFVPTVRSLLADGPGTMVTVGGADSTMLMARADALQGSGARVDVAPLPDLVADAADRGHVLVALRPVLVPQGLMGDAQRILADPRVATLSFWCNAAGPLSFPHRNTPSSHQINDLDERSVTDRLRSLSPVLEPIPVPAAVGPLAILGQAALSALGGLEVLDDSELDAVLFKHSMRAQRRGFVCLLDPSTYVSAPFDLAPPGPDPSADPAVRDRVFATTPAALAVLDRDRTSMTSPLAIAHSTARSKVLGLRLLIDGTCLGPKEMGTQVQTLNLIRALADRPDVARIEVTLAGDIPPYAQAALSSKTVHPLRVRDDQDVAGVTTADVAHRPFQPDRVLDDAWRGIAARTVVTVQDLIAYRNGAYHESGPDWLGYRDGLWSSVHLCDGLVVISEDVRREVELERLPVSPDRTFVVENGTDHLTGDEPTEPPTALVGRPEIASRYLLVVGANYAHKNRDLAIGAVRELRNRGFSDLNLVLVGAAVPFGSSRVEEALAHDSATDGWCLTIPDVPSAERNWLFRHAELVLYPTAAEGFGLVPFEAARFGTPVVSVPFGPLIEVLPDAPVASCDWNPRSLADAAAELLDDPDLAAAQVAASLRAGEKYTWDRTAAGLVEVYRQLLALPCR